MKSYSRLSYINMFGGISNKYCIFFITRVLHSTQWCCSRVNNTFWVSGPNQGSNIKTSWLTKIIISCTQLYHIAFLTRHSVFPIRRFLDKQNYSTMSSFLAIMCQWGKEWGVRMVLTLNQTTADATSSCRAHSRLTVCKPLKWSSGIEQTIRLRMLALLGLRKQWLGTTLILISFNTWAKAPHESAYSARCFQVAVCLDAAPT